jgi:DMSO/TMAO reductase YedYZ molybdopterin-dependent catalytic subunit
MPTKSDIQKNDRIPPGQQLVAPGKWPVIGQRGPNETSEPWQLSIIGLVENPVTLSLEQLRSQPQHSLTIDIHCVTRWSKLDVNFSGVLLETLLNLAEPQPAAKFCSFVSRTDNRHSSSLDIETAVRLKTLITLDYQGRPLDKGHGGPIRGIVPGRYFYKSVKWVEQIELLDEDRLGDWEADSGYHNHADPWREERYMAPSLDKREAARLIACRDFTNQELRSIDCSKRDLEKLNASQASLRDARFNSTVLNGANFQRANLSNAHFKNAKLVGAVFCDADVEGADFSGADLRGADFTGASLVGTSFYQPAHPDAPATALLAATIDSTTSIPKATRAKLFPDQLEFVEKYINT